MVLTCGLLDSMADLTTSLLEMRCFHIYVRYRLYFSQVIEYFYVLP